MPSLEPQKAYIQKNPLFGRKVVFFDRIRDSVWDWQLCDATVVTIDREPEIVKVHSVASSVYDHQGLEEIPVKVFRKVESLTKLYESIARVADEQQSCALRQETLGKIVALLTDNDILSPSTYDEAHMKAFADFYEQYSKQQMERVTDVIDVHK